MAYRYNNLDRVQINNQYSNKMLGNKDEKVKGC